MIADSPCVGDKLVAAGACSADSSHVSGYGNHKELVTSISKYEIMKIFVFFRVFEQQLNGKLINENRDECYLYHRIIYEKLGNIQKMTIIYTNIMNIFIQIYAF